MFNKFKYVLGQIFGMFLFVLCGFVGGYIYAVGEYKNAEKRAAKDNLETTKRSPELEEPDPISFQHSRNSRTPVKGERKKEKNLLDARIRT
jgi:hypothetical protein